MKKIDVHCHVFDVIAGFGYRGELRGIGGGRARWANGEIVNLVPPELGDRSFTDDALVPVLQAHDVEKAVLLQGSFYGFSNDYSREAAKRRPGLFTPAVTVDPFCKGAKDLLGMYLNEWKTRILKFEVSSMHGLMGYHNDFAIDGPVLADLLTMANAAGATVVFDMGEPGTASYQPAAAAAIAKRHPAMRVVICHLLFVGLKDEAALIEGLKLLALPNVWFDLAGVASNVSPEKYPYPTGQRYIALGRDLVGADKLMWGTDAPSVLTRESYANLSRYIEEGGIFSDPELEKVFRGNALDAYPLI
jgi:predicted TIM-barrel fold metal-dependent hydrolase